jgi:hypothetical protein
MRPMGRTWLAVVAMGVMLGGLAPLRAEDVVELPAKGKKPEAKGELGTFTGKIVLVGERPVPKVLRIPIDRAHGAEQAYYASLKLKDESLLVGEDGGLQNVVVWVGDQNIPVPVAPRIRRLPLPAVLKFQDGQFHPRVLAFESWRVLEFRNEDAFATTFHWWAAGEDSLNQLLRGKESAQFMVPAKERPLHLSSDIYQWPKAWLFPVAHPYFAVTDADGTFRIDRLPPGNWEFHVWHERFGYLKTANWPEGKFKQEIRSGRNELGTVSFKPPAEETAAAEKPLDPRLVELRTRRADKNEKGNASEFAGKWKMKLPAGFEYIVQLKQTEDGLLQMTCEDGALLLLGDFSCRGSELQLVQPRHERIEDYIWTYRDGKFVLTEDKQSHGGHYLHAVLTRVD